MQGNNGTVVREQQKKKNNVWEKKSRLGGGKKSGFMGKRVFILFGDGDNGWSGTKKRYFLGSIKASRPRCKKK